MSRSQDIRRVIAGFVLAPLSGAVTLFLLLAIGLLVFGESDGDLRNVLSFSSFVAAVGLVFALVMTLLVGVPLYFFARQAGWVGPAFFVVVGALLGLLCNPLLYINLSTGTPSSLDEVVLFLLGMISGAVGGAVFWRILYK